MSVRRGDSFSVLGALESPKPKLAQKQGTGEFAGPFLAAACSERVYQLLLMQLPLEPKQLRLITPFDTFLVIEKVVPVFDVATTT